ncbi:nucleotidyltransferase family protein [Cribrihabitans pelagius]|uniref:nucleotidyltransferase family protein n=1 Tax=Cribrihabitans pelagius TaxID=1765746 RepID=UPI003B5AFEA9
MPQTAILLLAAGASTRMRGSDKLLVDVDAQPLLTRMCRRAALTGLPVFVTLPSLAHPRAAVICDATPVAVPDAAEGMAASIRQGVAALTASTDAVMILPADMPEITTQDMMLLAARQDELQGQVLRACAEDGTPGHPVLFPRRCFEALQALTGDRGARSVLAGEDVRKIPLPGRHAVIDLDTPEAWAKWRKNGAPP